MKEKQMPFWLYILSIILVVSYAQAQEKAVNHAQRKLQKNDNVVEDIDDLVQRFEQIGADAYKLKLDVDAMAECQKEAHAYFPGHKYANAGDCVRIQLGNTGLHLEK